jgi:hypothetical protein
MRGQPISLLSGLLALSACAREGDDESDSALDQDAAAQIVIDELVEDDDLVLVYRWPDPLDGDSVLAPSVAPGFPEEAAVEIDGAQWFFWIDEAPYAAHQHASQWVLVDRDDGELTVSESQWRPRIDGDVAWGRTEEIEDPNNWAWAPPGAVEAVSMRDGLVAPQRPRMLCEAGFGTGIVINGSDDGDWFLEGDMTTSAKAVEASFEDLGFDMAYANPRGGGDVKGVDMDKYLADQAMKLKPGDTFVVYITGHGGNLADGSETGVGGVFEKSLAQKLGRFDPGVNIIVVIDGCHSGGMIDGLADVADLTVTATSQELKSTGDKDKLAVLFDQTSDPDPEDEGMEFTSAVVRSLDELKADPEQVERITAAAADNGVSFTEELVRNAFNRSRMYDVNQISGYTDPQIAAGSAKTKPVQPPPPPVPPACQPQPPSGCSADVDPKVAALDSGVQQVLGTSEFSASICASGLPLEVEGPIVYSTGQTSGISIGPVDFVVVVALQSTTVIDVPPPCDAEVDGVLLCADPNVSIPESTILAAVRFAEGGQDPTKFYQYAVVLDRNDDDSDDYSGSKAYPADFFIGSDIWYEVLYTPSDGWSLQVTDASNGKFTSMSSAARAIVTDDQLLFLIPGAEIETPDAEYRMTAFEHEGDYGAQSPWSGDLSTAVADPMLRLQP